MYYIITGLGGDPPSPIKKHCTQGGESKYGFLFRGLPIPEPIMNDPSAGSPTETLLRLLLPLNDQV